MPEIFPTLDPALTAARLFLCSKVEDNNYLAAFADYIAALRVPAVEMKERVRAHVERLHNIGQINAKAAAELQKQLEAYALGNAARSLATLEQWFRPIEGFVEGEHDDRLKKLTEVVRAERAKGA